MELHLLHINSLIATHCFWGSFCVCRYAEEHQWCLRSSRWTGSLRSLHFWLAPRGRYTGTWSLEEKKENMLTSRYRNILCINGPLWGNPLIIRTWKKTRQIWGIWKLRPAYSPETPNLGQNQWCFVLCDLEIGWMTLENNRPSLLCCFKLCATFHSHRWIQTGVTVRKDPIWVKFNDF